MPLEQIPALNPGFDIPVQAMSTTRMGGISQPPFDQLNLGMYSGDDAATVAENRTRLAQVLPNEPLWLQQVHGTDLIHLDDWQPGIQADAAWTDRPGQVAAVLTADCLPILVADPAASCVAVIHAGWRGLAADIIEKTLNAIHTKSDAFRAWIGPSIRQPAYEVGDEVKRAFEDYPDALIPNERGRWQADLQRIAIKKLQQSGVRRVEDSGFCTFQNPDRFYSCRRGSPCGRQASMIWIE